MHGDLFRLVTATLLLATVSAPARAQRADRDDDARGAAERTLDRSRRLKWIGIAGGGMSAAATLMPYERMTGRRGTALVIGGVTALGLGVIGDFAWYRGKTRLDTLDQAAVAEGTNGAARADAERALRQGRRLNLIGDIGVAMTLAAPFFPTQLCGPGPESCGPVANAYILGAATALGVGIVGLIKTGRAERRLAAFNEMPQASHRFGVAPLPDGVTANYSVAW